MEESTILAEFLIQVDNETHLHVEEFIKFSYLCACHEPEYVRKLYFINYFLCIWYIFSVKISLEKSNDVYPTNQPAIWNHY